MKNIQRIHLIIQQFKTAKEASVAVATCLTIFAVITIAGSFIDVAKYLLVQNQLNNMIKATALAAVKEVKEQKRQQILDTYANSNWGKDYYGTTLLQVSSKYDEKHRALTLRQSATIPTHFFKLFGIKKMQVESSSWVQHLLGHTELIFTIDMSHFMGRDDSKYIDASSDPYGSPMQQSKQVVKQIVDHIFAGEEFLSNIHTSIVPYSGTVNIGPENTAWTEGLENMDFGDVGWKGCVMARHSNSKDLTDHPPNDYPFRPFLWPSTYGKIFPIRENGQWAPITEKHPQSGKQYLVIGDNNWQAEQNDEDDHSNNKRKLQGPNMSCPPPILPLTKTYHTIIEHLENFAYSRGSSLDSLGLIWAARALSPRWKDVWNIKNEKLLPARHSSFYWNKTIILIAHGNNTFDQWEGKFYDLGSTTEYQEYLGTKLKWETTHLSRDEQLELATYPAPTIEEIIEKSNISGVKMGTPIAGPFTAYGHLQDGNLNSTDWAEAQEEINKKFLKTCDGLHQQGVYVQIITLDPKIDKKAEAIYQKCVIKPEHYHNNITQEKIKEIAKEIVDTNLLHVRVLG